MTAQRAASHRPTTLIYTMHGSTSLVGRLQPRFNLVVTHVGIDDQELGALSDMHGDGARPGSRAAHRGEGVCAPVV